MTILRPVTKHLPSSTIVSDQSGLPFSFAIVPYSDITLKTKDTTVKTKASSKSSSSKTTELKSDNRANEKPPLLPADSIPKCGTCGALLNPSSPVYSYPSKQIKKFRNKRAMREVETDSDNDDEAEEAEDDSLHGIFFCGLCGSSTSLHPSIQGPLRMNPSRLGDHLYTSRFQTNAHEIQMALERNQKVYSQRDRWRFRRNVDKGQEQYHRDSDTTYVYKHLSNRLYPECHNDCMEFSIPLFPFMANQPLSMEMDAVDCPLLLSFVILDHAPNKSFPAYIPSVCQSIRQVLKTAPTHAKIGLFFASHQNISVFDLSSSIPHIKHMHIPHSQNENDFDEEGFADLFDIFEWNQTYVTCTPENNSNIESVLRALEDSLVLNGACRSYMNYLQQKQKKNENKGADITDPFENPDENPEQEDPIVPHLALTLQVLLNYLERGHHPGDVTSTSPSVSSSNGNEYVMENMYDGDNSMCYAGGKIMVFLPQAPMEIGEVVVENGGHTGTGGFGGACSRVGQRFSSATDEQNESNKNHDETQLIEEEEEEIMNEFMNYFLREKADVADWYCELGAKATSLAMGIEIFGIQSIENSFDSKSFGFPLLRLLSDRSGGCGPLLICLQEDDIEAYKDMSEDSHSYLNGDGGTFAALLKEVQARCPWERACAFGAMLRVRTSPSFAIDVSPPPGDHTENTKETSPSLQLNRYCKTGGMMGPCIANPFDTDLWHFGTCDKDTCLAFDMEIISSSGLLEDGFVKSDGDFMNMPPCVQTSFIYTAVIPTDEDENKFKTVRRLRVLTTNLTVAENTEHLSLSLDEEALAVVLFHKMISYSILVGLRETRILGQNWLLAALLATYRSAERHYESQKSRRYKSSSDNVPFYPNERLLSAQYPGIKSHLSSEEVLLGEGHEAISSLPLIIFSLLHCDAIRPAANSGFSPSLDSRVAAAANMSIMSPATFARAIAPRLELWSADGNEMYMDKIRMNRRDIENAAKEIESVNKKPHIFFLDSPWQIMLYKYGDENDNDDFDIHDSKLGEALDNASMNYRVVPPIYMSLSSNESLESENSTSAWERFTDAMIEDLDSKDDDLEPYIRYDNAFDLWCKQIAKTLHKEIMSNHNS